MRIRSFSEQELKEAIESGLTHRQLAEKFKCTISLISLRMGEYQLSTYNKYINTKNYNGQISVIGIVRTKGKHKFECICLCGNKFEARPTDIIHHQIKSCGCLKPRVNGTLTKTFISKTRNKAKHRNIEFNISLDYLKSQLVKQDSKCPYSGLDITFPKSHRDTSFSASLDRIDSTKGYVEGNVQFVDKRVNSMKNDMTELDFINLCEQIYYVTKVLK